MTSDQTPINALQKVSDDIENMLDCDELCVSSPVGDRLVDIQIEIFSVLKRHEDESDKFEELKNAIKIVLSAVTIMPDLVAALETARRNGDNALTLETKQMMDEAISLVRGAA